MQSAAEEKKLLMEANVKNFQESSSTSVPPSYVYALFQDAYVARPQSLFCLDTGMFLMAYAVWSVIMSLFLSSKCSDTHCFLLYIVGGLFPLIGFFGVAQKNRLFIAVHAGYLMASILVFTITAAIGTVFLMRSDVCEVLADYFSWDFETMEQCAAKMPALRVAFLLTAMMIATVESYVLVQLKKYYNYIKRLEWTAVQLEDGDVFPGNIVYA